MFHMFNIFPPTERFNKIFPSKCLCIEDPVEDRATLRELWAQLLMRCEAFDFVLPRNSWIGQGFGDEVLNDLR